jgi:hypothetical protein
MRGGIAGYVYVFVRDNFDALDMASGFKNLFQNLLGNARIHSANIQRSLVWLGCGTADEPPSRSGRGHTGNRHRRSDGRRNRVCVLRDNDWGKRWRRHMAGLIPLARSIILVLRHDEMNFAGASSST